jgi:hypothetical protein
VSKRKYPAKFRAAVVRAYWEARPRRSFREIGEQWKVPADLVRFWVAMETQIAERTALRTLIGSSLLSLVTRTAVTTGHEPAGWVRRAVEAELRRHHGLRRYSLRRRGVVVLGPAADVITGVVAAAPKRWTEIED